MSTAGLALTEILKYGLTLGIAGLGLLTILGWLRSAWWLLDIASHFRVQYGILLALGAALAWWLGLSLLGLVAALLAFSNLVVVLPLYTPSRSAQAASRHTSTRRVLFANLWQPNRHTSTRRVLFANLWQPNCQHDLLRNLVEQIAPDLVLLVESNQRWLDELESLRGAYPFWVVQPREDNYGVALLSRWPVRESAICAFSAAGVPTVVALVELDGQMLQMVCTHPPPPKSQLETRARDEQLANMAAFVAAKETPLMVCGDLNLTPWSPMFWQFTRRSGLSDSARGFGVQASWPVGKPYMGVQLDHCLVSPEITILDRRLGTAIGSDHFPVIVDFCLPAS